MARCALVIGIARYDHFRNLDKAATDAAAIAHLFQTQGRYQVEPLPKRLVEAENRWELAMDKKLTGQDLGQTLETFLLEQATNKEALIYFAGHGFEVPGLGRKQKGYLATSDSTNDGHNAILFNDLNDLIRESNPSSLVLILDCCHAGSFLERTVLESTLTTFKEKKDYYLITACRSFERAREGEEHGVFTAAVLKGLQADNADSEGTVTGDRLFDFVQRELRQSGQEPIRAGIGRSITLVTYPSKYKPVPAIDESIVPYRGLEPFEKEQAEFFFGRKQVVEKIWQTLNRDNFVAVIGASGSGKSSLVRAGLIPWVEVNGWETLTPIKPGFEPLAELMGAFKHYFKGETGGQLESFIEDAQAYPNGLINLIESLPGHNKLLLIIDQFEELLTLCLEEEEEKKQRFIKLLAQVTKVPNSRLSIVITIRADFFKPCLEYFDLNYLLEKYLILMPPLVREDLEKAIRNPAEILGYRFETGLLGSILDDLGKERGCLPLLQFTLRELWERRDREKQLLKLEDYQDLGGVIGALNRRADQLYQSLDQQQKDWIKQIFLKLVKINLDEPSTRQRQPKTELSELVFESINNIRSSLVEPVDTTINQQEISDLIDRLIDARLLVTDFDKGVTWIDLAHEALIEQWTEFSKWQQAEKIRLQIKQSRESIHQTQPFSRQLSWQNRFLEPLTEVQQQLYVWLVDYVGQNQHSPSIRQMMKAMGLTSPAPIQSRLNHLQEKGYIDWTRGKARTLRLNQLNPPNVPILGASAAEGLTEVFPDVETEHLDFSDLLLNSRYFALRIRGQGMIDALIDDKDVVIMEPVLDSQLVKNGTIVAVRVNSQTTLRYFHRQGNKVILQPGNVNQEEYPIIEVFASQVEVQGTLIGVWRGFTKF